MTRIGRDIRNLDDYHLWTHPHRGTLDMRTPIVDPDTGRLSWQLRPDLILQGCIRRGCRVKLYMLADGAPTFELEPGGTP